ncbi:hypothetical protein ABW21_db0208982 [Orbilia brochopaga]|nr:hypothetical protein ABW21_db0208982 [Drechslerella brochopaga]
MSTKLFLSMALGLPVAVLAAADFTLVPGPNEGVVIGTNLGLDPRLQNQCIEFAAVYYPYNTTDLTTTYQPPDAPRGYNVRLYQDVGCTKPIEEDGWPWEDGVEYDPEEWVFGYYQLTSEADTGSKDVNTLGILAIVAVIETCACASPAAGLMSNPPPAYDTASKEIVIQNAMTGGKSGAGSSAAAARRVMSPYFIFYIQYSSTDDWEAFNIPTTDYDRCYA